MKENGLIIISVSSEKALDEYIYRKIYAAHKLAPVISNS